MTGCTGTLFMGVFGDTVYIILYIQYYYSRVALFCTLHRVHTLCIAKQSVGFKHCNRSNTCIPLNIKDIFRCVSSAIFQSFLCVNLQVVLLLVMFFMRKRVALTISLFHVAGKVFIHLPLLALQPFWTFLCLMLFWVYWIAVLLTLGTSGESRSFQRAPVPGFMWIGVYMLAKSTKHTDQPDLLLVTFPNQKNTKWSLVTFCLVFVA